MPLYEYQCEACGHRFEAIQKFSEPPIERCPSCGGHVRKLVSSPAFQFKGTGWYVTDYAKKTGTSDGKDAKDAKEPTVTESKAGAGEAKNSKAPAATPASPSSTKAS